MSSTTPDLRQLRFDEVLERVDRDGDLIAPIDENAPLPDKLTTYRRMRDSGKTPEPVPQAAPATGGAGGRRRGGSDDDTFVIQEHHARRLHYDFRLERNGVLVSWAVPKNLPETTSVNHLAVHTEDHPLEYATFEGKIPRGEYGGGDVIIWDSGTYETEKFRDNAPDGPAKGGEVIVTLHGSKISGRYALIQTGRQELAGAPHEGAARRSRLTDMAPMLATHGSVERLTSTVWAIRGQVGRLPSAGRRRPRRTRVAIAQWARRHRRVSATRGAGRRSGRASRHPGRRDRRTGRVSGVPSFGAMQNRGPAATSRVLGVRRPVARRSISVARQVLRPPPRSRGLGRRRRPDRPGATPRRWAGGTGVRPKASVGRRCRQAEGLDLPTGAAFAVVDQGQAVAHPGGGDRRLARRRGRPHQRHRRTAGRRSRGRRPALRRPRRHRLHREGSGATSRRRWRRCIPTNRPSPKGFPDPTPRA